MSYDPVGDYLQAFPDVPITPAQAGLIAAAVKAEDADIWADTILLYVGNFNPAFPRDYNPRKVGTMLDVFRAKKAERERRCNGADRQLNGISYKDARAIEARERLEQARQLAGRISEG